MVLPPSTLIELVYYSVKITRELLEFVTDTNTETIISKISAAISNCNYIMLYSNMLDYNTKIIPMLQKINPLNIEVFNVPFNNFDTGIKMYL